MDVKNINWKPLSDITLSDIGRFVLVKRNEKPISFGIYKIKEPDKLIIREHGGIATGFFHNKDAFEFLTEIDFYKGYTIKIGTNVQYDNAILNSYLSGIKDFVNFIKYNDGTCLILEKKDET